MDSKKIFLALLIFAGILSGQVITDGLVAYYPFDGDLQDHSGNGHHLHDAGFEENNSLLSFDEDRKGNENGALHQGMWDAGAFGSDIGFPIEDSPRTVCLWTQCEGTSYSKRIIKWGTEGADFTIATGSIQHATRWQVGTKQDDDSLFVELYPYQPNTWTHIAVVYDGRKITVYWDGKYAGLKHGAIYNTILGGEDCLLLGRNKRRGAGAYMGSYDDLCVFNRALTESEIDAIYKGVPPVSVKYKIENTRYTVKHSLTQIFSLQGRLIEHKETSGLHKRNVQLSNQIGAASYAWRIQD